jgi:hypothetical protein
MLWRVCVIFFWAGWSSVTAAATNLCFREDFESPLSNRWQQVKFEALTAYAPEVVESNRVLVARAHGTASAFATRLDLKPASPLQLSWRWKIDGCPTNATDDCAKTFDHTARVFVVFDTWLGTPRSINYVWANHAPTNSTFDHPRSGRTKFITLRTGAAEAGRWCRETRDVAADWARLFPGVPLPKLESLGVFTDSDGTRVPVTAWYDDFELRGP